MASASGSAPRPASSCVSRAPSGAAAASTSSCGLAMSSKNPSTSNSQFANSQTRFVVWKLGVGNWALTAILVAAVSIGMGGATPKYFPDDPIQVDDDRALDAGAAKPIDGSNGYDFVEHTFLKPFERNDVAALNVNTVAEVPDSSWFTNRIGRRDIPIPEIVRGPDRGPTRISLDGWIVAAGKGSGVQPGFRMTDPSGQLYQIEVDPPEHPEMASGAEIIGT